VGKRGTEWCRERELVEGGREWWRGKRVVEGEEGGGGGREWSR